MLNKPTTLFLLLFAAPAFVFSQAAKPVEKYPERAKLAFWSAQEKPFGFRNMEKIAPGNVVKRGGRVTSLPYAPRELAVEYRFQGAAWNTDRFMEANNVAGLLVLHEGKILLERYALGLTENGRWTSFSVAKSFTSTLVAAAVRDGKIQSLEDPVTKYLPALKGSAYDGVSLRNVLNMASGVKWNEDYTDPKSDVLTPDSSSLAYMSKLPRAAEPGTKFNYNTGETHLVGKIVIAATGKPLATYLSEKVWSKLGMEQDAFWMRSGDGLEMGGCCLSVSLRDYGRFALFIQNGGAINGSRVFAPDWMAQATQPTLFSLNKDLGRGYGYQWWTGAGGTFFATGIFGQHVQFFPDEKLVVISLSAWPVATDRDRYKVREAYLEAVRNSVQARRY